MDDKSFVEELKLDFDPDALREKYSKERDKRVRADGNAQYVEVTGKFAHYLDDPYVKPDQPRTAQRRGQCRSHRRRFRRIAGWRALS